MRLNFEKFHGGGKREWKAAEYEITQNVDFFFKENMCPFHVLNISRFGAASWRWWKLKHAEYETVCCSMLQYVAVCCSVLQCVAVCCSVLQYVAVCCSVLQCVAVRCSVLQRVGGWVIGPVETRGIRDYTDVCVYICVCMYVCIFVSIFVHTCMYYYIFVCIRVWICILGIVEVESCGI